MILYLSNSTDSVLYNELLVKKLISPGNQMQKFNNNIILGLSNYNEIVAMSVLQYNCIHKRIEKKTNNIQYICAKSGISLMRKITNVVNLFNESRRIIKKKRPDFIICDAIALSPCYVAMLLGTFFHIPTIGIITDLPGMFKKSKNPYCGIGRMRHFDKYVLLTNQMNDVVNPKQKPYLIMEGLCSPYLPSFNNKKADPRTILYTGSLWKHNAGIEYFVEGFISAKIPNCELHFYGTGELIPWIEEISRKNTSVKYMGNISNDEIIRKQSEATLLINPRPSNEEFCKYSFPSKTIEYMTSGTPILTTKLPGIPLQYFNYVFLIEEETANGVKESLNKIFDCSTNYLMKMGEKAREFVMTEKSCEVQSKKIWDFINRE